MKDVKKLDMFDVLKNLSEEKEDRWYEFSNVYNSFMITRFLSMNKDTVLFADLMNRANLTEKQQYNFYLYAIPKKRRYFKYVGTKKDEEILEIQKTYNVRREIAKAYSKILNK
jgi:hypothetical protein